MALTIEDDQNEVNFSEEFVGFPVSELPGKERPELEQSGKIILPETALQILSSVEFESPLMFKLTNTTNDKSTHCGVLEFTAESGKVFMASWILSNLELSVGGLVRVESVTLPAAHFVRFQPTSVEFLNISNPKAVLETQLRNHACLTEGDVIDIHYNNQVFGLKVNELQPADAVCIINCDVSVDFLPPDGYKEIEEEQEVALPDTQFPGTGVSLDGKKVTEPVDETGTKGGGLPGQRGIPDNSFQLTSLRFLRNCEPEKAKKSSEEDFTPFQCEGNALKETKND